MCLSSHGKEGLKHYIHLQRFNENTLTVYVLEQQMM